MGKVVQRLKHRWTGETELIPTSGRVSRVPPASNVLRQFIVRPLRVDPGHSHRLFGGVETGRTDRMVR